MKSEDSSHASPRRKALLAGLGLVFGAWLPVFASAAARYVSPPENPIAPEAVGDATHVGLLIALAGAYITLTFLIEKRRDSRAD